MGVKKNNQLHACFHTNGEVRRLKFCNKIEMSHNLNNNLNCLHIKSPSNPILTTGGPRRQIKLNRPNFDLVGYNQLQFTIINFDLFILYPTY